MSGRSSSDSVAAISASSRCSGPSSAAGRDLDALRLLERALREGREVREPLDLDVEQLAAHGALLGGGVDVEDVAAQRELAAVLDLVDALVAARDEPLGHLLEVEQLALRDLEAVRAQRGVGHLLAERRDGRDHDARPPASRKRVERRDPQADEVRRRREVRLVPHAARRVEPHGPRREECLQVGGEVARRAVVAGHDERGPAGIGVEQRRQQVRPQARRDERALRLAAGGLGQRVEGRVLVGVCEQLAKRHGHDERPRGASARLVTSDSRDGLSRPERRG